MTRPAIPIPFKAYWMIVALPVVSTALASQPPPPRSEANRDEPAKGAVPHAGEAARREAERVVSEIALEVLSDGKWARVERIEKPLLYYGDHTRNNDQGSLWAWGRKGRPLALLELWRGVTNRNQWAFAVCNTSGRKLRATRAGVPWWRENDSASELEDIPGAPAPSAEASQRQRQLKLLARKFTGHELWDPDNSRYELRQLARPLYTYRDEAGGVLEGGLFTLANGTNPEIMLFVEARTDPKDKRKAVWQYTVGRLAHAELHLEYDGKEVFDAPRGNRVSAPDKPYWLGFIDKPLAVDREKE